MKPHLLPMHYRLGRILGLKPEDVKRFYWEASKKASEGPQPAVVAGTGLEVLAVVSLVASAISVGLTIIAQFFRPGEVEPARLQSSSQQGRSINDVRRYAPREGFDSLQQPAAIGQPMPIIFALRETIDGQVYGGIRVNCDLLWSQLQTYGGQQLLRTIFLLGDGGVAEVDPNGFALGNNLLNAYNLGPGTQLGSSYSLYARLNSGRITSADYIAGRLPELDPGNSQNLGGSDVFSVRSVDRMWAGDFCSITRPSTNAVFGVYSLIGNNLAHRISPVIRPEVQAQLVPKGDDGDARVVCERDEIASAQRDKARAFYSTRSGIIDVDGGVQNPPGSNYYQCQIGATITYILDRSSDAETNFADAFTPKNWTVEVEPERVGGSGTNVFEYSSSTSSTRFASKIFGGDGDLDSQIVNGIQWLNENNQVVSSPVVTLTELTTNNIKLSAKLQYNGSSLTNQQKGELLYTRFRLKFVNDSLDDNQEPSVYYRVAVEQDSDVESSYLFDPGSQSVSGSYSNTVTYSLPSVESTRKTVSTTISQGEIYSESASDVASTIAGKQEQWDDAIQIGSLYKIGTALAVCTSRIPDGEVFYSEANFSEPGEQPFVTGQTIRAIFTVVRAGVVASTSYDQLTKNALDSGKQPGYVATNFPHILRVSIASIVTTRPTRLIEIIVRSNLGIRINNLCNFREAISYSEADGRACNNYSGDIISKGSTLKQYNYYSGTITTGQMRYSFFRIRVRISGSSDPWIEFPECFCFRGVNQQNQFNTIRMQFPSVNQWEIEFEPLSGWEIRSRRASGTYILVDDRRSYSANLITSEYNSIVIHVYGVQGGGEEVGVVPSNEDSFRLPAVRKDPIQGYGDLGYGYSDDNQFVDKFGALAEAFIYSEVTSSAEGGPEHEIVSVTEIIQNDELPLYPGMAKIGLNLLPGNTFQQLGQFSSYVNAGLAEPRRLRNGMLRGPTHLFPDIALELLTNPVYGAGDLVSDDQIDIDSFKEAAEWCYANRYFYDAVYLPTNIKEWVAKTAEEHLLHFLEIDGRFALRPMFPSVNGDYTNWNQPVDIKGVFGLLQMRSFSFSSVDEEARRPIQVSGRWREERKSSQIDNAGIFPVEREILIREAGSLSSENDPIQSFDLSDFATNEKHLIDYLKMKTRIRRLATHGCTIELTQDSLLSPVKPGDYVQVPVEVTFFDEYRTGVIRDDGVLVATSDIPAGSYSAAVWNGDINSPVTEQSINAFSDGTASPTGVIFAIKESNSDLKTYRILDIDPAENGGFTINMIESPVDSSGRLLLSQNWGGLATDPNWIIKR